MGSAGTFLFCPFSPPLAAGPQPITFERAPFYYYTNLLLEVLRTETVIKTTLNINAAQNSQTTFLTII